MRSLDFVKAMTLDERYSKIEDAIESGELELQVDEDALLEWRERPSSLSDDDIDDLFNLKRYRPDAFSVAIQKEIPDDVKPVLERAVAESDWFANLNKLFSDYDYSIEYKEELKYLYIFVPFIEAYRRQIQPVVESHSFLKDDAIDSLCISFANSLYSIALKTVIVEIDRVRESLEGETEKEELDFFLKQFGDKARVEEFYKRYSNLARRLVAETSRTTNFTQKVLDDLSRDKEKLENAFDLGGLQVSEFKFGEGDTHCGGESVIELLFDSDQSIFYKPRPRDIQATFSKVIDIVNADDSLLDMKATEAVFCDDHAYEKKVVYGSCASKEEVARCYGRFGQLLAISYLFNISDLHMENIVVSGEYPIIVDGETFLSNRVPYTFAEVPRAMVEDFDEISEYVTNSIILPSNLTLDHKDKSVDLGALSGTEQTIADVLVLKDADTSKVRLEKSESVMAGANNRVYLDTEIIDFRDYASEIREGFSKCVNSLLDRKDELQQLLDGVNDETRVLIRPTSHYARIHDYTLHPACQVDALEVDAILKNLYAWPDINNGVFEAEYRDLLQGDIPYFTAKVDEIDLADSKGNRIPSIFNQSSVEKVSQKIAAQTEESIKRQITLIDLKILGQEVDGRAEESRSYPSTSLGTDQLLEEAKRIGDRLLNTARRDEADNSVSWPVLDESRNFDPMPIQTDMHTGLAGIGLFLYYLGRETGDEKYTEAARACFESCEKPSLSSTSGTSAYIGPFGTMYFGMQLLRENPNDRSIGAHLRNCFVAVKRYLQKSELEDKSWLTGGASLLVALVEYFKLTNDDNVLSVCDQVADTLIEHVEKTEDASDSGMAHGVLGVAVALRRLSQLDSMDIYERDAQDALRIACEHWDDMDQSNLSWCRGASGMVSALAEFDVDKSAELASTSLLSDSQGVKLSRSDWLCHGTSGEIDALINLGRATEDESYFEEARLRASAMLQRQAETEKFSGVWFDGFPSTSLMRSEVGTGYALLRLLNPEIPSVLMLK